MISQPPAHGNNIATPTHSAIYHNYLSATKFVSARFASDWIGSKRTRASSLIRNVHYNLVHIYIYLVELIKLSSTQPNGTLSLSLSHSTLVGEGRDRATTQTLIIIIGAMPLSLYSITCDQMRTTSALSQLNPLASPIERLLVDRMKRRPLTNLMQTTSEQR